MKQKIITGIVSGIAFIGILFAINTVVFPFVIALLSAIAVFEIGNAVHLKNRPIQVLSIAVAAFVPLLVGFDWQIPLMPAVTAYVILVFLFMLLQYEKTRFEHAVFALFASLIVPYAFSTILLLRDVDKTFSGVYTKTDGIFFVILGLFCAWLTDIFAYFAGSFLGKHKLAPKISPKKTIEGAIGGIVGTMLLNVALLAVFNKFFFEHTVISYWAIILTSVLLAIISICGDLTASTLKRNYNIKDFGSLLPGHGGIMDRFDSYLFVMPVLYSVIVFVNR
ncbi:MAG: phosphatidate cytidylyltransferase [Oscillospiraceae bacterium]|nr:phosphatidate cytidylyltransferase [Oscillospiraceae bacterium]